MIHDLSENERTRWKESEIRRPGRPVIRWLLDDLAASEYCEGVTADGIWVSETADGLVDLAGNGWLVLFKKSGDSSSWRRRALAGGD